MNALSRLTQQLLQPQLVQQRLWGGEHRLQGANAQDERLQGRDGAAPVLDLDTVAPQERWLRICLMMQIRHFGDRHQSNGAFGSDGHSPGARLRAMWLSPAAPAQPASQLHFLVLSAMTWLQQIPFTSAKQEAPVAARHRGESRGQAVTSTMSRRASPMRGSSAVTDARPWPDSLAGPWGREGSVAAHSWS